MNASWLTEHAQPSGGVDRVPIQAVEWPQLAHYCPSSLAVRNADAQEEWGRGAVCIQVWLLGARRRWCPRVLLHHLEHPHPQGDH